MQQSSWLRAELTLPAGDYRLVFQAERGYERYTMIFIDDILVTPGPCTKSGCDVVSRPNPNENEGTSWKVTFGTLRPFP